MATTQEMFCAIVKKEKNWNLTNMHTEFKLMDWIKTETWHTKLKAVADPGFSPGGGANSQSGYANLFFWSKIAWKWKNFGPQGGARVPGAPP